MKAKDLRNSILQLAVQGKLVPQDPNDEPASVLLERIRAERAELLKEKKIKASKGGESVIYRASDGSHYEKRGKGEPVCVEDEIPFDIPESWEWVRLESCCRTVIDCPHSTPTYLTEDTGFYAIDTNCMDETWNQTSLRYLSEESFKKRIARYAPQPGDLVLSREGSIGRSVILSQENVCLGQRVMVLGFFEDGLLNRYCQLVLTSPYAWNLYMAVNVGTGVKHINVSMIKDILIPLPPKGEQVRMVEMVENLQPHIYRYDALEASRERLDAELLGRLRKSIMQQAVQGKLVAQDPSDEPASALLKRIRAERAKLVKAGKLKAPKGGESVIYRSSDGGYYEKRSKGEPVCIDDEIPFEIPDSWEWVRLESIMSLSSGLGYKKTDLDVRSQRMIRVLRGGNISQADTIALQDSDVFIADQFVDPNLMLLPGQIITPAVTSLENVGKAALVRTDIPDTTCGGFVFFLTPLINDMRLSRYLHIWLTSPEHRAYCKASVKKSGQAFYNLSKASLNNALIAVPPLLEQERIVTICERLLD